MSPHRAPLLRFSSCVVSFQFTVKKIPPVLLRKPQIRGLYRPSIRRVGNGFVLRGPIPDPSIVKDWYTAPGIPPYWSCDWLAWRGTRMWMPPHSTGSSLPVEVQFNGPFRLPTPIEPLVYFDPNGHGDLDSFAFRCGGKYCYYDSENHMVRRYHGPYASPTAFLVAEFAGFNVDPPISARLRELHRQIIELDYGEERRLLDEECAMEARNPPWNDLYTQLFEEDEQYRILVVDL
ncbi:hypothetical protein K438DRAFT_2056244 [Mycena galopus ATCC 62051]|nr:hypothetical protein K438DRAFT_2056244 [Mycena galopus ATCC 62051]